MDINRISVFFFDDQSISNVHLTVYPHNALSTLAAGLFQRPARVQSGFSLVAEFGPGPLYACPL